MELRPVVRDIVFLTAGTGLFMWEGLHEARWVPMVLAMLMALGPAFVAAYWSARTRGNGSSQLSGSPSPSPLPSPSSAGEPT